MIAFAAHQKRLNKLSFVVMSASKCCLCISQLCRVWNVCVHVCTTTNWLFICCLIICSCIYIVVINCGWNNNVAVNIVACWHWNIERYTSSWLDIHSEFVSIIHVRCESLNRGKLMQSDRLFESVKAKVWVGRPIWFRPLKLNFSHNNRGPDSEWLYMQVK